MQMSGEARNVTRTSIKPSLVAPSCYYRAHVDTVTIDLKIQLTEQNFKVRMTLRR